MTSQPPAAVARCDMCSQPTSLTHTSWVLGRTLHLCARCWDPDGSRRELEPGPPLTSRQDLVVTILVDDDGRLQTYTRYRETIRVVHRPGARYAATLEHRRVPIGKCPKCDTAGAVFETVQDPTHGEVHVHRQALSSFKTRKA